MRNMNKYPIFLLFLVFLAFSCATNNAPHNWLERTDKLQIDPYGGWITVKIGSNSELSGELIAVSDDSIFIANETLFVIAQSEISSARMVAYDSRAESMGGLVVLGTLSTISNGAFLIFTAPMWIIGGSIASSRQSFEPVIDYPKQEWKRFTPFARYPQGLPADINRSQIKMKHKS